MIEIRKITQLWNNLDLELKKELSSVGISCFSGCTFCCETQEVFTTYFEMMPLATHLIQNDLAVDMLEKLEQADTKFCILLNKNIGCSYYEYRPTICRLFGNSKIIKRNKEELVTCKKIKNHLIQKQSRPIYNLKNIPNMNHWQQYIYNVIPANNYELMPINHALRLALEKLTLKKQFFPT